MSRSEDNYKLTLGIKKLYPRIVSTKDGPSCFFKKQERYAKRGRVKKNSAENESGRGQNTEKCGKAQKS